MYGLAHSLYHPQGFCVANEDVNSQYLIRIG